MNEETKKNVALWESVCRTDPAAVKPITGKQYQGNSPKPYWIVRRLTETFGPCGSGWGLNILAERMEPLGGAEILHVARVRFWYKLPDGTVCGIEQIGQTKAAYTKRDGTLYTDEDAPKKSVTDALVKCASYLGFAGDIFSGRWDDSKYVDEVRKEFAALREPESKPPAKAVGPMTNMQYESICALSEATQTPMDNILKAYKKDGWNSVNSSEAAKIIGQLETKKGKK